jgi:hypothetical protein
MRDENIQPFEQYLRRRSPDRRTPVDYISNVRQFAAVCGNTPTSTWPGDVCGSG